MVNKNFPNKVNQFEYWPASKIEFFFSSIRKYKVNYQVKTVDKINLENRIKLITELGIND